MQIEGTVRDGLIVLEEGVNLAEGTKVQVILPDEQVGPPTLLGLLKLAGIAKGLPVDFAQQHDHYLHGTAKR